MFSLQIKRLEYGLLDLTAAVREQQIAQVSIQK